MNIVIRTDASIDIGTGHVMRCLTLAKQLESHDTRITFVCREFEGNSIRYLQEQGISVVQLPPLRDSCDWKLDAKETGEAIKSMRDEVDLLIVDHYGIDIRWESEIRRYTKYIMVIDDLADRSHDCDLLLDQNYYLDMHDRYKGLVPNHCVQLLGPNFVLLRDEFLQFVSTHRKRTGEVKNILVFFGGTDPTGETIKTLNAIQQIDVPQIVFNVVIGATNPKRQEIELMCEFMPNTNFYCQVSNMAELMWKADFAIGAGGSTTWERCLLGLPSLTVIVAKNQIELTRTVANLGATIIIGDEFGSSKEILQEAIIHSLQNPKIVMSMTQKCKEIINVSIVKELPVTKSILELFS